jgi:hypothetical protein
MIRAGPRIVPLPAVAVGALVEDVRTYDRQPHELVFSTPGATVHSTSGGSDSGHRLRAMPGEALRMGAGASPTEVAERVGHTAGSFTVDRNAHQRPALRLSLRSEAGS